MVGGTRFYERAKRSATSWPICGGGQPGRLGEPAPDRQHPPAASVIAQGVCGGAFGEPGHLFYEALREAAEGGAVAQYPCQQTDHRVRRADRSLRAEHLEAFGTDDQATIDATAEGGDIGDLVDAIVERTGYRGELAASNDPQDAARLDNLGELVSRGKGNSASTRRGPSPKERDDTDDDPEGCARGLNRGRSPRSWSGCRWSPTPDQIPDEGEGVVTLMTLHTRRGLEFPVVFVTGWEDGHFPHMRALGDPAELSEERRLAYVGITRAKERCT